MRKTIIGLALFTLTLGAVAFSRQKAEPGGLVIDKEKANPWTSLQLRNDPTEFQFAIVSDRTGGHRDKIFSQAVARLNLLQPEFVVSVGDLVEGGKKTQQQIAAEWEEFDGFVKQLKMPFFYVPGNHDTGNADNQKFWKERFGRRFYHFTYRGVMFLCLDTDDPPGSSSISADQADYAKKALADNPGVRHTIVLLHKPIWTAADKQRAGWMSIEKALADRPYTVFCGHVHRYRKYVRQGRNYYQLATTGGGSRLRGIEYGEFDHIVWVTMKKDGPVFANLMLDRILPEDLKVPESTEKGVERKMLPTLPVRGVVYFDGVPVTQAYLTFAHESDNGKARASIRADAVSEGDGSFRVSTYKAFDGLPAGKYNVAVVQRRPFLTPDGSPGPNVLPAKYATAKTSGLVIEVKEGMDEVKLELTK